MDPRDKSDAQWDEVADVMRRMRQSLDFSLAEALRRFAEAPDEPFSDRAVQVMVAIASCVGAEVSPRGTKLADLVYSSDANAVASDVLLDARALLDMAGGEHCDIVGWHPWTAADGLMTDIDSTSIDLRGVRWTRLPLNIRGANADPIVVDVGLGFDEQPTRQFRRVREGTLRWDACLCTADSASLDWASLDWAVACTTSFDFADYDDETIEELLRN